MKACAVRPTSIILLLICACAPNRADYANYLNHFPKSVLVLPPVNQSLEVQASGVFLSTITTPLAERGYYVLPVAVVDAILKENGVPFPPEMHQVPIPKLKEVFGADSILYITIKEWTTTYIVLNTTTSVILDYRLVDAETGLALWRWQQTFQYSPSNDQNDLISMAVVAAIHAAESTSGRLERDVATTANQAAFNAPRFGLLTGPRHPDYEEALSLVKHEQQQLEQRRAKAGNR